MIKTACTGTFKSGTSGTRAASKVPVEILINPGSSAMAAPDGLNAEAMSYTVAFAPIGGPQ